MNMSTTNRCPARPTGSYSGSGTYGDASASASVAFLLPDAEEAYVVASVLVYLKGGHGVPNPIVKDVYHG